MNRPGLSDVGDMSLGGSFGPFQLFTHGALPPEISKLSLPKRDQWAWSPQGIAYALGRAASVARGLRGKAAVEAIVRRFERPADPDAEVAKASSLLGAEASSPSSPLSFSLSQSLPAPSTLARSSGTSSARQRLALALASGKDIYSLIPQLVAIKNTQEAGLGATPSVQANETRMSVGPPAPLNLAELFYDPLGGYKNGQSIGAIGGHQTHVHVAAPDPQSELRAIALAQRLGLRVGENPYVGTVNPVHTKTSYHYRDFPGLYYGKRLGEAIDVSGAPAGLAEYYRRLARLAGY